MEAVTVKGTRVPALGFGTWQLGGRSCTEAVRLALELGCRYIDTAAIYDNETEVGEAIRTSGVAREAVFLTTKVPPGELDAAAAKRSTEASLKRLKTPYVDLLLIHWPNPAVPLGETLEALAALKAAGKTRHIGVSNFSVTLLRAAVEQHGADLLCNQVEYHPFLAQRAVLAEVRRLGMMLTAYAPLARGRVEKDATLAALGRKYGKSAAQIALRWLIEQPGVSVIPKATSRAHIAANLAIFDFTLSPEDHAAVGALGDGGRLVDWPGYSPSWDRA